VCSSGVRALGVILALSLLAAAAAAAKEFPPGGLMVCGATQCRVVTDAQSRAFSDLLWGDRSVTRAPAPRVGSPIYQLRFENGPAGAIISATAIRVHGLRCGRFERGKWYRLPGALRGVARGLKPKLLRASIPRSC
jgi:hypothetical protein